MIRPLRESDDPSGFSCGDRDLGDYLRRYALTNMRAGVSVTYVLEDSEMGIGGYVTLAAGSVRGRDLSSLTPHERRLPRYPLPVLLVARLAVDQRLQRQGNGRALVSFALTEAIVAKARVGCVGVVVDAKPGAASFYRDLGFEEIDEPTDASPLRMFLPIDTLADAL